MGTRDKKSALARDRTDWAEDRTDWAEDRTILANERTFASWLRTGLTALAVAIALAAIFGDAEGPISPARSVASIFVLGAIIVFWMARGKTLSSLDDLDRHSVDAMRRRGITAITVLMMLGAAGTGVLLWIV
ncbi:DUF202 domain-containing protein [Profundibacterium mesophilum]|nr:DUF202 domain-containing protein [Profundibacterium mesophilum]